MKTILTITIVALLCGSVSAQSPQPAGPKNNPYYSNKDTVHLKVTNAEWKKILPADLYAVGQRAGHGARFYG
jgi:peptide-methionine (R)-S-oxide reductase